MPAIDPLGLTNVAQMLGGQGQGDALRAQVSDQTEEEKRKRRLGLQPLPPAVESIFGMTGVQAVK